MNQKEDLQICNSCLNRIYNAKNELFCRKNLNNKDIQFFCSEFITEDTYEKKSYLIKEDKKEFSIVKVKSVFFWLLTLQIVGLIQIINLENTDFTLSIIVLFLTFLSIGTFVAVYFGKRWAKNLTTFIYSISLFGQLIRLGSNVEIPYEIIENLIGVLLISYILYFLNFDKDFRQFFNDKCN